MRRDMVLTSISKCTIDSLVGYIGVERKAFVTCGPVNNPPGVYCSWPPRSVWLFLPLTVSDRCFSLLLEYVAMMMFVMRTQ